MHTLLSFFGVLARLLRPTRGAHTSPCGYLWELGAEARRNRSRRVRRYVEALTLTEPKSIDPAPLAPAPSMPTPQPPTVPTPLVPAPRKPVEDTLVEEYPQVAIVRGPYLAWETARMKVAA